MKTSLTAAFVVPLGAKKVLGESGWEFASDNRLPASLKDSLVNAFKLKPLQSYLDIESYGDGTIKMAVIYDQRHLIENIYFQLDREALRELLEYFDSQGFADSSELFVPQVKLAQ